jgi:hypothetical protein
MPLSDYTHHNEEARRIWWEEEGRHDQDPLEYDDMMEQDSQMDAMDAFFEEHYEDSNESIVEKLCDADYRTRWPKAAQALAAILSERTLESC